LPESKKPLAVVPARGFESATGSPPVFLA